VIVRRCSDGDLLVPGVGRTRPGGCGTAWRGWRPAALHEEWMESLFRTVEQRAPLSTDEERAALTDLAEPQAEP
jgi:hypothetical protein